MRTPRSVTVALFPRQNLRYCDFSTTLHTVFLDALLFLFGNGTYHGQNTQQYQSYRQSDIWKGLLPSVIL